MADELERPPPIVPDVKPTRIVLPAIDCPVHSVTVFEDRAEVTRSINVTSQVAGRGVYEVIVEGFTSKINKESVRVKGTGPITILEVSSTVNYKPRVEDEVKTEDTAILESLRGAGTTEELKNKIKHLEDQKRTVEQGYIRLNQARDFIQEFSATHILPKNRVPLDKLKSFLTFSNRKLVEIEDQYTSLKNESKRISHEIDILKRQLSKREEYGRQSLKPSHDVTILFDASKKGNIQLQVIYLVSNTSWKPAYDVRVISSNNKLQLTYYATVKQNTEENWVNCRLSLSTAKPQLGGSPTPIQSRVYSFKQPIFNNVVSTREAKYAMHTNVFSAAPLGLFADFSDEMEMEMDEHFRAPPPPPAASVATSRVQGSAGAVSFVIERPTTIASDNKPHKTTVAILELESSFVHYSVPRFTTNTYIQAKGRNSSGYPLLATDTANIFFDNSFIATTSMRDVSPGEVFQLFLGVDPGVRVSFRKFEEHGRQHGLLRRSVSSVYSAATVIKNAKNQPITIIVVDQYPISGDDRVKVNLVAPTQDEVDRNASDAKVDELDQGGNDTVIVNPITHNMVWTKHLSSQQEIEVKFEYTIEHPQGEDIEILALKN